MTFSDLTIGDYKGFASQSLWEKALSTPILVRSHALQFSGVCYCQLRPDPQALIYICILSPGTIQRPPNQWASAETLFLHLLTTVSWLKQFPPRCLLYSSRPWLQNKAGTCVQDSSSVRQFLHLPDLPDSHLVLVHGIKREHWAANAYSTSCLHHCSKCIKAWLLHLVWVVVLWPLWNLAAPLLGTSHFRHRTRGKKRSHQFVRGNWPWLSVGGGIAVTQFSREGIYLVHR